MTKQLRIIFMGTPLFAVPVLKAIAASPHEVVAVYTQPPRPKGRGNTVQKSFVHAAADDLSLPVLTPENFKNIDDVKTFQNFHADIAVVAAYGLILPTSILDAPKFGCINTHASLLPRWRGAAPIQRAILAGDKETGVCFMKMEQGLDTGPIIGLVTHPITKDTTAEHLYTMLSKLSADHIVPAIEQWTTGKIRPQQQPSNGVTHAAKLKKEEGALDFKNPASYLDRKIRALNPWPGTWFTYQNEIIKVLKADFVEQKGAPGTVLDDQLTIACAEDAIRPTLLQKAGSKPMAIKDFLNGFPIAKDTRLS